MKMLQHQPGQPTADASVDSRTPQRSSCQWGKRKDGHDNLQSQKTADFVSENRHGLTEVLPFKTYAEYCDGRSFW